MHNALRLIVDFDGSLTISDTTALLSHAGLQWQARNRRSEVTSWDDLTRAYCDDLNKHSWHPSLQQSAVPSVIVQKFDNVPVTLQRAIASQRSRREVEEKSAKRVLRAAFVEVPEQALENAAAAAVGSGEVRFRPGITQLLRGMQCRRYEIEILSVNWSRAWIRHLLKAAVLAENDESITEAVARLQVIANELPSISGTSTPLHNSPYIIHDAIRTSEDKLEHLLGRKSEKPDTFLIHIGDSITDIECILAADIGICVHDEPMKGGQRELASTLQDDGKLLIREAQQGDSQISDTTARPRRPVLLRVRDLDMVTRLIDKLEAANRFRQEGN